MKQAPEILPFSSLVPRYAAFLLDAYGVFWGSNEVGMLPGAAEAMKRLVREGKRVGILSNSTQLAQKEVDKLAKHGILQGIHYHFFVTSGEITRSLLLQDRLPFATPRKTFWLFGKPNLPLFHGTMYEQTETLEAADFIYLGVPQIGDLDQEDPTLFHAAVQQAAINHIPVLCANPDQFAHEGLPPRLVVRQGSIATLFLNAGCPIHYVGKPSLLAYETALAQLPSSIEKRQILMVGDTPETDIRGAKGAHLSAALVTKTGVMAERIQKGSLSVLNALSEQDLPDFLIERFQ